MKTSQLEEQLEIAEEFDEALIRENGAPDFLAVISARMKEKGITRAELIKRLDIDRSYGYQLLNGIRRPTRRHVIQMALLLELDIDSFQKLLKAARKKPLYVRDMFDAKVFFAVKKRMNYESAVEFIWNE